MTNVLLLLWLSDMADVARLFITCLTIVTMTALVFFPAIVKEGLATWKQCLRWFMATWAVIGVLALIPSPKTLHIAAAAVAAERSAHAEIDQEIKQAVLDELRGTAKEGEK